MKALAVAMFCVACSACESSGPDLKISAKNENGFVSIKNNEANSQSNCVASINGNYFLKNQYLPANDILSMSSFSFSNSSDERFNPSSHTISSVSLQCGDRFGDVEF
jgi:hypothetical protein